MQGATSTAGGIEGRDDTAKVWERGSQVETGAAEKRALQDAGPHTTGLSTMAVWGQLTPPPSNMTRDTHKAGRDKRKKSGFSLPLVLHSPHSAFPRFSLAQSKLSREYEKYTLFCMKRVENGFEKTQINDRHVHQISSRLVPWLSFSPLSHPSSTLRSLSIDLYRFCSSAAFCCFQDNI